MYLDDGVSRDSAPRSSFRHSDNAAFEGEPALVADREARGRYRKVCIYQVSSSSEDELSRILTAYQETHLSLHSQEREGNKIRKINIRTAHDGYGPEMVARDIGEYYRVVIWHEKPDTVANVVTVTGTTMNCRFTPRRDVGATVGYVPVEADDAARGILIEQQV